MNQIQTAASPATVPANSSRSQKPISIFRTLKNIRRFAADLIPPAVSKLFQEKHLALPNESTDDETVEFLIPAKRPSEIWPAFGTTEVTMLPRHLRNHLWAMPENELLVLATICKLLNPVNVFEFGTFTGGSTLAIAANTPSDTEIVTLDIPPEERRSHRTGVGSDIPFDYVIGESYLGTRYESKISSIRCNATSFDPTPYLGKMDLVFIDADHTYSFASSDTQNAIKMLSPNGVILWHDYRWDDDTPECVGVTHCVNEFHQQHKRCIEILGTRFAVYQNSQSSESLSGSTCQPRLVEAAV